MSQSVGLSASAAAADATVTVRFEGWGTRAVMDVALTGVRSLLKK
jgi:hypothetical protein